MMAASQSSPYFELGSGIIYADSLTLRTVDTGQGPPNLQQFRAMGRLLLIDEVVDVIDEASEAPPLYLPIGELLVGSKLPVKPEDYEHLNSDEWGIDQYISYGRWLHSLVTPKGRTKSSLSERLINRAYHFGIGVSPERIKAEMRFRSMSGFYKALKIRPTYEASEYDDMTVEDIASYLEEVYIDLSDDESSTDTSIAQEVERRASIGKGPTLDIIFRRSNGMRIMELLALRGYADSRGMTLAEHRKLGVRFMIANGGRAPNGSDFDALAKRRRTPTWRTIYNKFGSSVTYRDLVKEDYEALKATESKKAVEARTAYQQGSIPVTLFDGASNLSEVARRYEKWQVIDLLLPMLHLQRKIEASRLEDGKVFRSVLRSYGASDSDIDSVLEKLDLRETIHEDEGYLSHLRITP